MREKRWTRGEWRLSDDGTRVLDDSGGAIAHVLIPDGCAGQRAEREEQAVANAHLMRSAPGMLALLEAADCPDCDGSGAYYDSFGDVCQCQWCDERKRVIAMAYGEVEPR